MKLFKKKTVYIVLIIIFTLILIADLVIRFAVPAKSSSSDRGEFSGMSGSFSGDFDPDNMPSDFDPNNMPSDFSGFQQGSMPDGFTPGDRSSRPGRSGSEKKDSGFVGTVKKFWIPIAAVCVLINAVCVFMLLRISKKNRNSSSTGKTDSGSKNSEEDFDDSPRRKKPLWILLFVPVLVIAILLKTLPKTKKEEKSTMSVKENIVTAETEKKMLSTVYLGGGTLSQEEASEVSVPGSIKIDSYAVSNGDMVQAGDLIATVNKPSVLSQIRDVQETLSEIDEKLNDELSKEDREKLTTVMK